MNVSNKKRIAAQILKCGETRVRFNTENLQQIKEAITKSDIRSLIKDKTIKKKKTKGTSRARARHILKQKRKGRRTGPGKKSGTHKARSPKKREWINKIRALRDLLATLKQKGIIDTKAYNALYRKSKGGFFRSRRHVKSYIEEHKLAKK